MKNDTLSIEIKNYLKELKEFGEYWFNQKKNIYRWFKGPNKKCDRFLEEKYGKLYEFIVNLHNNTKAMREIKNDKILFLYAIIALDQLSRHFYRNDCRAFEQDSKAYMLSKQYIKRYGFDHLSVDEFIFLMVVFQHQEDVKAHQKALEYNLKKVESLEINKKNNDKMIDSYKYTLEHKKVIEKFGYYPKRKLICGEKLTKEDKEYIKSSAYTFF